MKISYETAVRVLKEVTDEHPDRVVKQCVYGLPELSDTKSEPVCLVGHVLYRLLEDEAWEELVADFNGMRFSTIVDVCTPLVEVDDRTRILLHRAQLNQDSGRSWREATDRALEADERDHPFQEPAV